MIGHVGSGTKIELLNVVLKDRYIVDCITHLADKSILALTAPVSEKNKLLLICLSAEGDERPVAEFSTNEIKQIHFSLHIISHRSPFVLLMIGTSLRVLDIHSGKWAEIHNEAAAAISAEQFYDFGQTTDAKYRVLILCQVKGLSYVTKLDYDMGSMEQGIHKLLS